MAEQTKNIKLITCNNLESSINRDCSLILEAIRRLKEGTWCLTDEDSDWVDFLFPKITEALKDHIEFENHCIFPDLPNDLAKAHWAEHEYILTILWALDQSKQGKEAMRFHCLLDILVIVLRQHHSRYGCLNPSLEKCQDDCTKDKIMKRAAGSSLEY